MTPAACPTLKGDTPPVLSIHSPRSFSMPTCLVCDRRFANRDALVQHLATSSAWHPFCETCNRRFISKDACDGHMLAKHPPEFPCTICQRTFSAPFALDDHYRGSSAHPNCVKCGRGFRAAAGLEEHRQSAHPPCLRCGEKSVCEETIDEHYLLSENHPSCAPCKVGFKDEASEKQHALSMHAERCCVSCREIFESIDIAKNHHLMSARHKKCFTCNIGFENDIDHLEHVEKLHAQRSEVFKNEKIVPFSRSAALSLYNRSPAGLRSRMFPVCPREGYLSLK